LFSPILYIVLGFITIFILKIFNINPTIHLAIVRFIAFLSIGIVYLTNNYIDDFIIEIKELNNNILNYYNIYNNFINKINIINKIIKLYNEDNKNKNNIISKYKNRY
jgi:hypothetical protein